MVETSQGIQGRDLSGNTRQAPVRRYKVGTCREIQGRHLSGDTRQRPVRKQKVGTCQEIQGRHLSGDTKQRSVRRYHLQLTQGRDLFGEKTEMSGNLILQTTTDLELEMGTFESSYYRHVQRRRNVCIYIKTFLFIYLKANTVFRDTNTGNNIISY